MSVLVVLVGTDITCALGLQNNNTRLLVSHLAKLSCFHFWRLGLVAGFGAGVCFCLLAGVSGAYLCVLCLLALRGARV